MKSGLTVLNATSLPSETSMVLMCGTFVVFFCAF